MPNDNLAIVEDTPALARKFAVLFGLSPRIYQAPGRVNLIGEHTDYNEGYVMPAAIGFYTRVAIAARPDRKLVIESINFAERIEFNLDALPSVGSGHWSDYVVGVAKACIGSGASLCGANILIEGEVPQGAGLSSSASIEVAVAYALLDLAGQTIDLDALALLCQQAENEFVGARCGIMDQFISSQGKHDHALLLDCRTLEFRLLPLRNSARLVICNSMVKHSLATGEYNQRRAECEAGVAALAKLLPGIKALRDVTPAGFAAHASALPEIIRRRCRHIVTENARVLQAAEALESNALEVFGQLMAESHISMRDDFEISCPELDRLVELANTVDGVFGSRMTGGGFGGCTVSLVRQDSIEEFKRVVTDGYQLFAGIKPDIYVCTAADGVSRVA